MRPPGPRDARVLASAVDRGLRAAYRRASSRTGDLYDEYRTVSVDLGYDEVRGVLVPEDEGGNLLSADDQVLLEGDWPGGDSRVEHPQTVIEALDEVTAEGDRLEDVHVEARPTVIGAGQYEMEFETEDGRYCRVSASL